ncbi:capsule assembly protein Wzi [Geoanaerobacter pelophilus]|uniref:Capsule assembly protein Wzi n=2 Tax=Geoanaerobacter pelophilus TaxID=60036 RepID=A0ABQ0MFK6_9BACT|nr:capsule assembly protein Wzi [Geoanaerobacter pelophilus]
MRLEFMRIFLAALVVGITSFASSAFALSSANIPLDSPIYPYLEKLSGYGLVSGDVKGIRPFSKAEAARLMREAEERIASGDHPRLAVEIVQRLKELLPREAALYGDEGKASTIDYQPLASARLRYVHLDGKPRSYFRAVHDAGNDGVFGIGSGLRPATRYPHPIQQRGSEGTPLFENNDGVVYRSGSNLDLRGSGEAYWGAKGTLLLEPMLLWSEESDEATLRLNRGYLKLGGKGLELEAGRDENWLGPGYRGAITLTNNARNMDLVKLSSPELVSSKYLWDLKYTLIFSQLDKTVTDGREREPYFLAAKLAMKPTQNVEFGINLGRQVGGPGVRNGLGDNVRGLIGGWNQDNSNSVAGADLRFRLPWLRNSELYGEFSGEDAAAFWPIVESYVAGFFIPALTESGRDDLRFEYFRGNEILYANGTFPEGYLYHGLPIGHSQGGAAQEWFLRYSHWFSVRNNLALEGMHGTRGDHGQVTVDATGAFDPAGVMQAVERRNALRAFWSFPVQGEWSALVMYGHEWIDNLELRQGESRKNQLLRAELSYKY